MNLLKTAATVGSLTLLSRVSGLIRELLTASAFGASAATDAFFVAFRIPNLLRRLFAEGAFSQAFVPVLSEVRALKGDDAAKALVSKIATALFWCVNAITVLGIFGAPIIVWLIAGGFSADADTATLTVEMTRWMFPYILMITLVSLGAGVLNTWGEFRAPAFAPVLLNIAFIASALLLAPHLSEPIWALVVAVVAGGIAQLALQWLALSRRNLAPKISWRVIDAFRDPDVRKTLKLMGPSALALSVAQVSIIINTNLASRLAPGSVSWLTYADRLMEFPTALLGVVMGTLLLPSLSRANTQGQSLAYSQLLDWGLRLVLVLALPCGVALATIAEPLAATLFHYGRFDANDVAKTAEALVAYAVGLIGFIGIKVLAPGFFARQDTRTPMRIALLVLAVTQLLNFWTVPHFGHAGLALSVSLAAVLNACLLLAGLLRRGHYKPSPGWLKLILQLAMANALMATFLYFGRAEFAWIGMQAHWGARIAALGLLIVSAIGIYFCTLWVTGLRVKDFRKTNVITEDSPS